MQGEEPEVLPDHVPTERVMHLLAYALRLGAYIETAAAYAGITSQVLRTWLKRGAKGEKGYVRFHRLIGQAMAQREITDLERIEAAGVAGVWQAAAWRLERRAPAQWGQRREVVMSGKDGAPVQPVIIYMPDNGRMNENKRGALTYEQGLAPAPEAEEGEFTELPLH